MKKHLFVYITIMFIFVGCSVDNELKDSVFIEDAENPELPVYSEWVYNTFGAYYDRVVFVSNDDIVPSKVVVTNNKVSFILAGQQGSTNYYSDYQKMSIKFELKGFEIDGYRDLIDFNLSVHNLVTVGQILDPKVIIVIDDVEYPADVIEGSLTFKRVQNLLVDTQQIEVILSGCFDFKALVNNEPVTISDGRFDVGVGPHNFYKY